MQDFYFGPLIITPENYNDPLISIPPPQNRSTFASSCIFVPRKSGDPSAMTSKKRRNFELPEV
eukprot:460231-Amphidinium_carterae.1